VIPSRERVARIAASVIVAVMAIGCGADGDGSSDEDDVAVADFAAGAKYQSSVTIVPVGSSDGLAHYGGQVTFTYATTYPDHTWITLTCEQNGTLVYSGQTAFWDGYPWPWTQVMTLGSQAWTGGDADCTAELTYWNRKRMMTLATSTIHAYP
jgi:hypothetical protein